MSSLLKRFTEKIGKEKGLKIAVAIGFIGIFLILCSEFIPKTKEPAASGNTEYSSDSFRDYTEQKLTSVLSEISGVGKVSVMVTVSSTEEYIYANEEKNQKNSGDGKTSGSYENKLVVVDGSDGRKPLITKVLTPKVQGVVIVCEGAGSAKVCEIIYKSVSAALDIPSSKIYVAKLK